MVLCRSPVRVAVHLLHQDLRVVDLQLACADQDASASGETESGAESGSVAERLSGVAKGVDGQVEVAAAGLVVGHEVGLVDPALTALATEDGTKTLFVPEAASAALEVVMGLDHALGCAVKAESSPTLGDGCAAVGHHGTSGPVCADPEMDYGYSVELAANGARGQICGSHALLRAAKPLRLAGEER